MKRLSCATMDANTAKVVEVESAFVRALPGFSIVGLPSQAIQESRDRIKSALLSTGFSFPAQKITVNLSPSDLRKEGSHFDLCIALLIALQKEKVHFEDFFVFGELGLDGKVKATVTLFSLILSLASTRTTLKVLVPKIMADQVAVIPNVTVYGVESLEEALAFFKETTNQEKALHVQEHDLFAKALVIEGEPFTCNEVFTLDFADVKGQDRAKRAALIAAAGMHNILFEGSPGCGKSMSVKRLRYILPPMSVQEVLESAAYRSLNGEESTFEPLRPYRAPHHTSSRPSIFGGGSSHAKVGEVALAHRGILFFDEFPHFSKSILESLREPLEDGHVLISRVNAKISYETKFLFAAAQNPCPCGNLFNQEQPCRCTDVEIQRYKARLSIPLLDRIDLYVQMDETKEAQIGMSSAQMYAKVLEAFKAQKRRKQQELNALMSDQEVNRFCRLDETSTQVLQMAANRYGLSQRGINKTLKVARTIADIDRAENIQKTHLLEALSYRQR